MAVVDLIALALLQCFVGVLNAFPLTFREKFIGFILRSIFALVPSYRRIAMKNLTLVYPHATDAEKDRIYRESIKAFGRIFIDLARLHTLDEQWVRTHLECPFLPIYERIKREQPGRGVLFATGHLGSFEVMAHSMPIYGYPISFIVRSFNLPRVNNWWKSKREMHGNMVIDRKGAVKEALAQIGRGRDVGVLFDQNVKRNHAVFVPFFGRLAATTKLIGIAALKYEMPIIATSMAYLGNDRYRLNAVQVDCSDLYRDQEMPAEEKALKITERVTKEYEKMILANPEEWFWFHRRWKTTPEGVKEDFYR